MRELICVIIVIEINSRVGYGVATIIVKQHSQQQRFLTIAEVKVEGERDEFIEMKNHERIASDFKLSRMSWEI